MTTKNWSIKPSSSHKSKKKSKNRDPPTENNSNGGDRDYASRLNDDDNVEVTNEFYSKATKRKEGQKLLENCFLKESQKLKATFGYLIWKRLFKSCSNKHMATQEQWSGKKKRNFEN